ncbi:MAG: FecR domain-containing protein [Prolixibacteraceae bacterium]|jgi:ferric-dicitrate binding protein FerR (iron transport regulator)|nr:FecR domain-containing protein [Prolixibacteraceae bacterium]
MSEINSIIQKYLLGRTSEEEELQLYLWMKETPDNEKRLFAEKDIWDLYGFHFDRKSYEVASELELLKSRIESSKIRSGHSFMRVLKLAAMFLVVFGLGWASRYIHLNKEEHLAEVTMQDVYVPKGQVNQLFLADGTRIWINSETRLTIPSVFAPNERIVKLNGEAFFEVAKDKKRPFRVEVNGQQIEVLGTSFNVRAYNNSNEIETTLASGQIRLLTGGQTTLLKPGEQGLFDRKSNKLTIDTVDPESFISWKDGRYEFHNKDLIEVFKVVERWYDVDITADETQFKGMHFSGVIKRNKDVKHFLEMLNKSISIRYVIDTDKVRIENAN